MLRGPGAIRQRVRCRPDHVGGCVFRGGAMAAGLAFSPGYGLRDCRLRSCSSAPRRTRDPDEYLNEPPIQRSAAERGLLFGYDTSLPIGRREIMEG